jgi:hypothetical protein
VTSTISATLNVWHERLAHVNHDIVKKMATGNHIIGMDIEPAKEERGSISTVCVVFWGKCTNCPPLQASTSLPELENLLIRIWWPIKPMHISSPNGAKYYVVFKDDYTVVTKQYISLIWNPNGLTNSNYFLKRFFVKPESGLLHYAQWRWIHQSWLPEMAHRRESPTRNERTIHPRVKREGGVRIHASLN